MKAGQTFADYLNEVLFHYSMCTFKRNQKEVINNVTTQDLVMLNTDHGCTSIAEVNQEQHSSDQNLADQYKNANFLNTLGQVIVCLQK